MDFSDPFTPERYYTECRDCLRRVLTAEPRTTSPDHSVLLQNTAVPRE